MGKGYIYRYLIIVRIMLDFGIICRNKFLSLYIFFFFGECKVCVCKCIYKDFNFFI